MSSQWITQCPHCGTSFRVTEQHLRAAQGAVRCGSCLHVFNAIHTLFPEEELNTATHITTAHYKTPISPAVARPFLPTDDDAPNTQTGLPSSTPNRPIIEQHTTATVIQHAVDDDDDMDYLLPDTEVASDDLAADDTPSPSWASTPRFEVVNEQPHEAADEESALRFSPASPSLHHLHWQPEPAPDFRANYAPGYQPAQMWGNALDERAESDPDDVDDPFTEEPTTEHNDHQRRPEQDWSSSPVNQPYATTHLAQPTNDEPSFDDDDLDEEPRLGHFREPFRDALLSELEAEPPRFDWQADDSHASPFKVLLGLFCIALLSGALFVQHMLFHYAQYASTLQRSPYQELLTITCQLISCAFIKTDLAQVRSDNLIIRADSQQTDTLLVDTLLTNNAPFDQPFPLLYLKFTDFNSQILAERIFNPHEYLQGELQSLSQMPSKTPLQIHLAIKNPSDKATNYELILLEGSR